MTDASAAARPRRAIVIPMYNEAARIGRTLQRIAAGPLQH
jgi:hypothetical protein